MLVCYQVLEKWMETMGTKLKCYLHLTCYFILFYFYFPSSFRFWNVGGLNKGGVLERFRTNFLL